LDFNYSVRDHPGGGADTPYRSRRRFQKHPMTNIQEVPVIINSDQLYSVEMFGFAKIIVIASIVAATLREILHWAK